MGILNSRALTNAMKALKEYTIVVLIKKIFMYCLHRDQHLPSLFHNSKSLADIFKFFDGTLSLFR